MDETKRAESRVEYAIDRNAVRRPPVRRVLMRSETRERVQNADNNGRLTPLGWCIRRVG
jgi:hypothetical protein